MPDAAVHVRPDRAAGRARQHRRAQGTAAVHLAARCRRSPADDVVLEDLVAFFKDPVKGFFRALDYTLPWDVDGVEDAMPVEIDALEEWTVGDRMLDDMLRGMTPDEARQAEWRRGTLPPGQLGWRKATEIKEQAALLAAAALRHRSADPQAYDVDIDLGAGRRLTGTVSPVFGDRLVSVTYSKLDGKHLLESWIPLLALIARDPDRLARGVHRPREEGHHARASEAWAAPTWTRSRCCASSWRSTTRAAARRFRCPQDVLRVGGGASYRRRPRTGGAASGGSPATATPPRTRRRHTYAHGAAVPT